METETEVRASDPCAWCGEPTAFGSGRFVNRIPVDDGWGCAECAGYECDECGGQIYLDTEVRVDYTDDTGKWHFGNYHEGCHSPDRHGPSAE
jgi:hypothetical protein